MDDIIVIIPAFNPDEKLMLNFVNNLSQEFKNIIIEPKYEMVTEFNEYGFAGIKQDGKWGSIDTQGNIIAEPIYEMTESLPDFINQYYKVDYGYGIPYYTK